LIGRVWKFGDRWSRPVLIDRATYTHLATFAVEFSRNGILFG
jgi:hypothetical protein